MLDNTKAIEMAYASLKTYSDHTPEDILAAKELVCNSLWETEKAIVSSNPDVILLGEFGVDLDVLIAMKIYLSDMSASRKFKNDPIYDFAESLWSSIIQVNFPTKSMVQIYHYRDQTLGEIGAVWDIYTSENPSEHDEYWFQTYKKAIDSPAVIPYFANGITDLNLIEFAVLEGIDAHLLSTLTNAVSI